MNKKDIPSIIIHRQRAFLIVLIIVFLSAFLYMSGAAASSFYDPPDALLVKQADPNAIDGTCTLASAVMVLRSYIYRYVTESDGECLGNRYTFITEALLKSQSKPNEIWTRTGLSKDFTFSNNTVSIRIVKETLNSSNKKGILLGYLSQYPEGIAIQGSGHTVFLYAYDQAHDIFKCIDPYNGKRKSLVECQVFKNFKNQNAAIHSIIGFWHVDHNKAIVKSTVSSASVATSATGYKPLIGIWTATIFGIPTSIEFTSHGEMITTALGISTEYQYSVNNNQITLTIDIPYLEETVSTISTFTISGDQLLIDGVVYTKFK